MSASCQGWLVVVKLCLVKANCPSLLVTKLVLSGSSSVPSCEKAKSRPLLLSVASGSHPLHSMTKNDKRCSITSESIRVYFQKEYTS